ncbi:peptidase S24, S26A and S26B [Pseudomonas sp. StFLB209]|uniref:LexA family transcriptional regulator n=1 Tax=Pseudomonas sp. StFLB209 TaxID=1028989 RepID=UPI0004F609BF|nr:LexA family transcriptional regulator [Pseudomonas sp. StFLB209]BAP44745.1 peptidase S24, S26A and S26B [Pseudomonas sp. StFLB209]
MTISDIRLQNLRRIMAERQLRLTDIADLLGKAPAQVSAFGGKNPTKGIGNRIAREIEQVLHLQLGELDVLGGTESSKNIDRASARARATELPMLDLKSVDSWMSGNTGKSDGIQIGWINSPGPVGEKSFGITVEGLSMEPFFQAGDRLIIDPSHPCKNDSFVLAKRKSDNFLMIRQLKIEGNESYLLATNPSWPNRIEQLTDAWCLVGRAMWVVTQI